MEFPSKLRQLIKHTRLSQEAIAKELGVSQNLISRWVRGKNNPDIHQGFALAKILGVSLDYLVDEEDGRQPSDVAIEMKAREVAKKIGWEAVYDRLIGVLSKPNGSTVRMAGKYVGGRQDGSPMSITDSNKQPFALAAGSLLLQAYRRSGEGWERTNVILSPPGRALPSLPSEYTEIHRLEADGDWHLVSADQV